MRIIKEGIKPEDIEIETTCNNYKSVLGVKISDGKTTYDQRDGNYVTIVCPVCQKSINIDLKKFK